MSSEIFLVSALKRSSACSVSPNMPTDSIFKSLYCRPNKGETETDTDTDTETKILGYSNIPNQTLGAYVCARCSSQLTPTVQNVYSA